MKSLPKMRRQAAIAQDEKPLLLPARPLTAWRPGAAGIKLIDTPQFPEIYKAEEGARLAFLKALGGESMLEWTLRK
nr:hypothetical protein [uncultured Pseudogulbenkiania sp.]